MPPAKKAAPKKGDKKAVPVKTKTVMTAYQLAVKSPAKSAGAKTKTKPYDAKWKAEVAKKSKAYDKSFIHKYVEPASKMFGPMAGIASIMQAATGKDLNAPAGSKKKTVNRAGDLAAGIMALTPLAGGKKVKKVVKGLQKATKSAEFAKSSGANRRMATKTVAIKKKQMGNSWLRNLKDLAISVMIWLNLLLRL